MEQKYKRGNLVKILCGHVVYNGGGFFDEPNGWIDIDKSKVGKTAVIIGSYKDLFGGSDIDSYSVVFCDTGIQTSWKRTNEMEFIDEGGEQLIEQAKKTLEKNLIEGKIRPILY